MVLAPEHPLVESLTAPEQKEAVQAYVEQARRATEIDRLSTEREKTGVPLGAYAVNHLNGERIPLYIADYVLTTYGTGIVMGVPAHDQRDYEFARKHGLEIRTVIAPPTGPTPSANIPPTHPEPTVIAPSANILPAHTEPPLPAHPELVEGSSESGPPSCHSERSEEPQARAFTGDGVMVNSAPFNDLPSPEGADAIADLVEENGWGRRTVSHRIRDWLVSRQRYWGTPIPFVYCDDCGAVPVPDDQLPVLLPLDAEFKPTGESPLAINDGFVNAACPACDSPAKRETDTMDTFVDSSWYMFRFASPAEDGAPFDPDLLGSWLPVDQYTGGAEHAVMHLLYSRFFTKGMRDMGMLDFDEPFLRLFNQGTIIAGGAKMSKSRGNVISPDAYVGIFGADVVRVYLMFLGPWDQGGDWTDTGINGISRWMNRMWDLFQRDPADLPEVVDESALNDTRRKLHQTIEKVHTDLDRFKFNTSIASLMELTNHLSQAWNRQSIDPSLWRECTEKFLLMLAPFAPHIAEELWERTGRPYSVHNRPFPKWDANLTAEETITLVVQVNGRLPRPPPNPRLHHRRRSQENRPGQPPSPNPHPRQKNPKTDLRPRPPHKHRRPLTPQTHIPSFPPPLPSFPQKRESIPPLFPSPSTQTFA